ncbi:UDP-N-acetylglucosamine transferase subunit ALG14 [Paramisgurnus dabryanus]|uniref:UDP-N-acetylglucosamine transferase subunit ALG14 n=1 Tax=Paramisgurnus dabryanus TaxID=90735 RepID=UPI0031F3EB74
MGLLCGAVCGVIVTGIILITVFILRLYVTLRHGSEHKPGQKKRSLSVLVVAGSGGHTTEIIRLMGGLSQSYNPRHYVIADTDQMSEDKIRVFETEREKTDSPQFTLHRIPRSREVRQSWSSSVLSSLSALLSSVPLVFRLQPDVILCNGPGTCVPLCAAGLLLSILGVKKVVIVYVESICRVETLSLSGKILYYFADYFFVQWVPLKDKYPKAIYLGRLV